MRFRITTLFLLAFLSRAAAQSADYTAICVAFYNFENLFDTLDSPDTDDLEFTPHGPNLYTGKVYYEKLHNLSRVVAEIGTAYTPDGPALLGVSEVENRLVLADFVHQPAVAKRNYGILHRNSLDGRGIDVALLYNPRYFTPEKVLFYALPTSSPGDSVVRYSRDILIAIGDLLGERVAVSVNHWPSRRGGEQTTAHLRNAAAAYNARVLDSLAISEGITKSIVMGDLNDDPINESVRGKLRARKEIGKMAEGDRFNPFENFYRKGFGTTAYQNAWGLFDQIILSGALATAGEGLRFYKAGVHNPPYLVQRSGAFKGYPMRTYAGGVYQGGYSDHFPVYVILATPKKK